MELKDLDQLDSYFSDHNHYSADFKALVLRIYATNGGNLEQTCLLSGISPHTLRNWIQAWNQEESDKKKP